MNTNLRERFHSAKDMRNAELMERSLSNRKQSANFIPLKYIFEYPIKRKSRKRNWRLSFTIIFPIDPSVISYLSE